MQQKKVTRSRKGKKTTTEVTAVKTDIVPSEGTIGGDDEIPVENATQENQAVAKKIKPLTKPRKKNISSPPVRENIVETTGEDAQAAENEEEEQRKKNPYGVLVILVGSNGGLSQLLRQAEGVEEPKMFGLIEDNGDDVQREGKGAMSIVDEERDEEVDRNVGIEENMTPCDKEVAKALSAKKSHKMLFTRVRLRSPSS
ncbi:hypothetical protein Dimus_007959 [Dionaea muscipula]